MSLKELTDYLLTLKCDWAINLDGGGSSSMYYEGKIVNNPTGDKDEGNGIKALRRISDAIIIKKKWY
ncbi:MAG: phosphodiester glycosidase family protein [Sphingobacteriia bacterium]|nr:phosphodiester glycosidase family protein [Sphingobacteriia bacterium]